MKWKVLGSDYLLKSRWLKVRKDHVMMPSGVEMDDYFVLEYPDWVNVIAITDKGEFIIEQQYRHGTQTVDYELCAGTLEKNETALEAAQRELLEETGFAGGEWTLYCESAPNPAAMTNMNYTYIAMGVKYSGSRHLENTEDIKIDLLSYEELKQIVKEGKIKQGQMLAPLWKYIAEHQ